MCTCKIKKDLIEMKLDLIMRKKIITKKIRHINFIVDKSKKRKPSVNKAKIIEGAVKSMKSEFIVEDIEIYIKKQEVYIKRNYISSRLSIMARLGKIKKIKKLSKVDMEILRHI